MTAHEHSPDPHHDTYSKTLFGFWLYLLTDFMLFAALFATYAVLGKSTFGGPAAKNLFHLSYAMIQTLILLATSLTSGLASAYAHRKQISTTTFYFVLTFVLGCFFLLLQIDDFRTLILAGHGWNQSAFLSTFYTLVGTHTLHIVIGLIWTPLILILLYRDGFNTTSLRRIACLKMFWQFLALIWIFIFTIVYLLGGVQ